MVEFEQTPLDVEPKQELDAEVHISYLLHLANANLRAWDQSYIFQDGHHVVRKFPKFRDTEIELGKKLGRGAFCEVFEISHVKLLPEVQTKKVDIKEDSSDLPAVELVRETSLTDVDGEEEVNYNASTAREYIATHFIRDGHARYAIKKLRCDKSELKQTRALVDLVNEIKLLSVIWHPHIGM